MPPKKRHRKRIAAEPNDSAGEDSAASRPTSEQDNAVKGDKRQQPLHLTLQQQDDVLSWFQENDLLYDKGHADYKLTEKKNALWKEKADELGLCDGARLRSWVDSIRTQYGKLTKRPSGSGGRLSDRDKWILDKLSFLSKHIYRVQSRGGVDLMKKFREEHPERIPDSCESGEDGENSQDDREEQLPSASPALSTASGEQDTSTSGNRKKRANREESTVLLQRLQERIQKSSQLQEKLIDEMSVPKDPRVAERRQWAQWFGSAITDIDDSLWSDFQAESLQLVSNFKARSKSLQQAAVQPLPLQPSLPSADQERADYHTAKRLQTINYSSNPGGYLPVWQQIYQPPPPMFPPQSYPGRSQSAPLSTTATITAGPTYDTVQSTSTGDSSVGQGDSLREIMTFSGITTVNESPENDTVDV